jgi:hypothetical protein
MTQKQWAEHLTYVAINRGLYYTGLSDKLEINLKIRSVKWNPDTSELILWVVNYPPIRTLWFPESERDALIDKYLVDGNYQGVRQ